MQIDTGVVAVTLAALSLCGAIGCLIALVRTRHMLYEQQDEMNTQFNRLSEKLAELTPKPHASAAPVVAADAPRPVADEPAESEDDLLAAITAAAAVVAGHRARIRSLQQVPQSEQDSASAWSQQGRVVVQSSHNISPHR